MHRCIGGVDGIQISDRIIVWYREYAHALWCMGWVSERVIYSVHVMSHYIIPAAVAIARRDYFYSGQKTCFLESWLNNTGIIPGYSIDVCRWITPVENKEISTGDETHQTVT